MTGGHFIPGEALAARAEPLPAHDDLGRRWCALEAQAESSFFQSWTWIGSWLRATGARPDLVSIINAHGEDVGLALIGKGRDKRLLGQVPTIWLNEAGNATQDRPYVEYNAPLALTGSEDGVVHAMAALLERRKDWRVLRLSGVEPGCTLLGAVRARRRLLVGRSPAYFIGLDQVRKAQGDYLSLLSSNSRSQIRRSIRDYGDKPARVVRCASRDQVVKGLADMVRLNRGRHENNAWDDDMFLAFAAEISMAGLDDGSVDLLEVYQGDHRVGLLLNFVHRGRAMNYQSAFEEPLTPKAKPGLMAHAGAVSHYADRGLDLYSLLAGSDRYKQSLATGEEALEWWMVERFSVKLSAEYWLRRLLRR